MTLFELVAKLTLDTSAFDANVRRANDSGAGLSTTMSTLISSSVALGALMYDTGKQAVQMVGGFAVDLMETTAAVKAENAAFQSVFKENADAATEAFQRISEADDIYVTRLKSQGTSFYTQFVSGGAEASDALDMMETALNHAADASAFYDISLEDASYRLRSFLRGNIEAGEAIGLFSNDVSRQAKAAELYGEKWSDLNEAQRETVLLAIATDIYSQAEVTGQAAREMDGYVNQLGNLKEQWRQTMAILGEPVLEATIPALNALSDFLNNNPETVEALAEAFGDIAMALSNLAIDGLEWLTENSDKIVFFIEQLGEVLGFSSGDESEDGGMRVENILQKGAKFLGPFGWILDFALPDVENTYVPQGAVDYDYPEQAGPVASTKPSGAVDETTQAALDYIFALDEYWDRRYAYGDEDMSSANAAYDRLKTLDAELAGMLAQTLRVIGIEGKESDWRRNEEDSIPTEWIEILPQRIVDALTSELPGAIASGLNGVGVYADGQALIGYVSAGLARAVRTKTHTGRKSV